MSDTNRRSLLAITAAGAAALALSQGAPTPPRPHANALVANTFESDDLK